MRVYLRTYGCRANQYDTEAVRSLLHASGSLEVESPEEADVAIFNSCTVTAAAEADLRSDVRRASQLNPRLRTLIMGCAAALPNRDELRSPLATLPSVEALIAGGDTSEIAAKLGIPFGTEFTPQSGARGLLRIQDGCDEHCTFCATTIARGANRSRSVSELVEEAASLAEIHPEIVLTGIHIGTFGRDSGTSLGQLVERLVRDVPRVRFRLSSVEATEVDDHIATLMAAEPRRVAPHLHAPLQSGSDKILRRMGRSWYTASSYRASVERLASSVSPFALCADVITGFPGETDEDHRATVNLVEQLPFTSLHVFPYSERPGTPAVRLRDRVPPVVVKARAKELRDLSLRKGASHRLARINRQCDVVLVERGKGLTEDYLSVSVADRTIPRRSRFNGILGDDNGILTARALITE